KQRGPLVIDDQGSDEAQEAVLQRGLSRLPDFQRAAGGRAKRRLAGAGYGQAQRDLCRDPVWLRAGEPARSGRASPAGAAKATFEPAASLTFGRAIYCPWYRARPSA